MKGTASDDVERQVARGLNSISGATPPNLKASHAFLLRLHADCAADRISLMRLVVSGNVAVLVARLDGLSSRALRAMREGLYEGGDKVRTKVRRALKQQTNVKAYASVTKRVPSVRAGLSYIIKGEGKGLPIAEFPVTASGKVTASPWGVSRTFKRSFVHPGNGGFAARLSSKRFPIRRLFGPSIAKEIVKDQSAAAFQAGVASDVLPAIERRLARVV